MEFTAERLMKLFIVEDNEIFSKLLALKLEKLKSYKIKVFTTGEEMLRQMSEKPDVIILDYYLNSKNENAKNGKDVLMAIKRNNPDLPVIILTSSEDINRAVELLKNGAVDYIVKNDDFFEKITETLSQIRRLDDITFEKKSIFDRNKRNIIKFSLAFILLLVFISVLIVLK